MSQSEVNAQREVFAGVVDQHLSSQSYFNAETTAEIPFGVLVVATTTEGECKLPTDGTVPLGVVMHSHAYSKGSSDLDNLGDDGLKPSASVAVLRKGTIRVLLEEDVVAGEAVRVRVVADTGEQLGAFRTTADSTDCAVLAGAQYLEGGSDGGTALLEIDMNAVAALNND
jgi:hypothetical protein